MGWLRFGVAEIIDSILGNLAVQVAEKFGIPLGELRFDPTHHLFCH